MCGIAGYSLSPASSVHRTLAAQALLAGIAERGADAVGYAHRGAVVGIHNGIIVNDEEIFARYGFDRAEPDMTVDSEAIFALAEHAGGRSEALEELYGAMAAGWSD